ncbi:MAG: sigma-E processing peptidase SpoIIGA [Clostridia bacterium]|nr:sigma-E processing peptidase SpoIIGA [Clostridia bacterium]
MKTVVYADVYFILNFSIDLICIFLCGAIAGKERKTIPICIAASVGGLYACISLFISDSAWSAILSVLICVGMYYVSFRPISVAALLYGSMLLFCVNALFGGIYSAIVSLVSGGDVNTERFMYYPLFLTVTASLIFARVINFKCNEVQLITEVQCKGKTVRFASMVDTGNSLMEPISGAGVALLSIKAAKRILSDEEISLLMGEEDASTAFNRGFRLIVLNTVAGSKKCFCAKFENVFVEKKRKRKKVCVYFAVASNFNLGEIECLLPSSLNLIF